MALVTSAENFSTSTTIPCTLAGLANAAARESAIVDNSTNLYDDAMFTLKFTLAGGSMASDKAVYVYFHGSEDGVVYTEPMTAADAGITLTTANNLTLGMVISCVSNTTGAYVKTLGSVAQMFGGVLPRKWGFIVQNQAGPAFNGTETNFQKSYTGVRASAA